MEAISKNRKIINQGPGNASQGNLKNKSEAYFVKKAKSEKKPLRLDQESIFKIENNFGQLLIKDGNHRSRRRLTETVIFQKV